MFTYLYDAIKVNLGFNKLSVQNMLILQQR